MKKLFAVAVCSTALLATVFTGCDWLGKPDDEKNEKITLTVKNESFYILSDVTFAGIKFATSGSNLAVSAESTKELGNKKSGYITFTRKDIDIPLRTEELVSIGDESDTFIIHNNTVVVEQGNNGNIKTLGQINFQSHLTVERGVLPVAKNDSINLNEAVVNTAGLNVFTIKNTGVGKLLFGINEPVQISDDTDNVFSVIQPAGSVVAPNASLTFTINFRPKALQRYSATVTVKSNDESGDYIFSINALGVPPKPIATVLFDEDEIRQNGTIDAGHTLITQPKNIMVSLANTGTEILLIDIAGITVTGANASAFSLATKPGESISVDGRSLFTVEFDPASQGENNAVLTIPTNDNSRNPILVLLKGTAAKGSAVVQLSQAGKVIANNSITPVDFGRVNIASGKSLAFTIKNTGNINMKLSGSPAMESSNSLFSVLVQPNTTIVPGGEASFILGYTPTSEREDSATITFFSNSDEMQFAFSVKGTGHEPRPQITVRQGNSSIHTSGEFAFGTVLLGKQTDIAFTVGNSGDANLNLDSLSVRRVVLEDNTDGTFSIVQQPSAVVVPGSTSTFIIRFRPSAIGVISDSVLRIKTDSRYDNEFLLTIRGSGRSFIIGDTGPGGGIVFSVQGNLCKEVSPDIGRYNLVGALKVSRDFRGGGLSNWRLATREELNSMYTNLHLRGLGGFRGRYWSSDYSHEGNRIHNYWTVDFSKGSNDWWQEGHDHSVRAVRSFTAN